jgi:lauroyl/myristoyl acyltransferase
VARTGRAGGALFYFLDGRHRRVAIENLTACFGQELSLPEIRALARENFRRIGENYFCAAKTASMTWEKLRPHCEFVGVEKFFLGQSSANPRSRVVAIGHFGNFELYARFGQYAPAFQCATTYRGIRPESLNRLLLSLREKSGCLYFERRTDANALRAIMKDNGIMLGLLCDQHASHNGLSIPFFDRECSTSSAPAIFALRYNCPLHTAICYRVGLARWRLEVGDEIPTMEGGRRRSPEVIMREVNQAFEAAVRRDPANWFWVHNRWKSRKPKNRPDRQPVATPTNDVPVGRA